MKLALLLLTFPLLAQAQPEKFGETYFPAQHGEKMIVANLGVNDKVKIISCDIGLLQSNAANFQIAPGHIQFSRYVGTLARELKTEIVIPPSQWKQEIALRALSTKVELPPMKHTYAPYQGFITYGFRVLDASPDRLAYDGSTLMNLPGYGEVRSKLPANLQTARLTEALCETARVQFNREYPEFAVKTLRAEGLDPKASTEIMARREELLKQDQDRRLKQLDQRTQPFWMKFYRWVVSQ